MDLQKDCFEPLLTFSGRELNKAPTALRTSEPSAALMCVHVINTFNRLVELLFVITTTAHKRGLNCSDFLYDFQAGHDDAEQTLVDTRQTKDGHDDARVSRPARARVELLVGPTASTR